MKTQGISLIVCLSIVLISSSATWADPVASALLRRGDMVEYQIGENPPVIREVVSITETSINYSGAYGALIKTDPSDVSHIWGSIPSITSGEEVIISEQIMDPPPPGGDTYNQKGYFGNFGLGTQESDKVLYKATIYHGTIYDWSSIWQVDVPLIIEEWELTPGMPGKYLVNAANPGYTSNNTPYWFGTYGTTPGGNDNGAAIFYGGADQTLIKTGDSVGGATEPVSTSIDGDFGVSRDGTNYIASVELDDWGTRFAVVINDAIPESCGVPFRKAQAIPSWLGGPAIGQPVDYFYTFDFPRINEAGDWLVTGITDIYYVNFLVVNGGIRHKEGDVLDGVTLSDKFEDVALNEDGDYAFVCSDDSENHAMFLNGKLLLQAGDEIDWDGDGSTDPNYTLSFFYCPYGPTMSMTGRDGSDMGTIYFIGYVLTPGDPEYVYFKMTVDMSLYFIDCNNNGIPDDVDISLGTSLDCNGNGIPDECDIASGRSLDCNNNDIPDECDIYTGTSLDCNGNDIPDECDIASGFSKDCNGNDIPDECDIASGFSKDCNNNGVPDECDIASGTSKDCNGNDVPDECDIAAGTSKDCNNNGIPDECDIAAGTSQDCNNNGIPDECENLPIPNLDFNLDRIVNLKDFEIMAAAWLTDEDQTDIAPCGGDDITDLLDLKELTDRWLEPVDYFPDTCLYAQEVTVGILYEGTTEGATPTDDANDITSCACDDLYDVWLYFTADQAGLYHLDLQGLGDFSEYARLAVFDTCAGNELACYRPCEGPAYLNATAETTYYVRIAGAQMETGDYQLLITYIGPIEPMTHDDCTQAYSLSVSQFYLGTTEGATPTDDANDITSCACEDLYDVWHTVTPTESGNYVIDYAGLGGEWADSIRASIFDACDCTELFCHQPCNGPALFQMNSGTPYYIRIAGTYSTTGIYSIVVVPVMGADECTNATALQKDTVYYGSTEGTTVTTVHSSCGEDDNYDVWYSYTAAEDEAIRITVNDYYMMESVLSVYDDCGGNELGCAVSSGGPMAGESDVGIEGNTKMELSLTMGQTIYIRVSANWDGTGVFQIELSSLPDPPAFSECANAVTVQLDTPYSDSNQDALTSSVMSQYCGGYHDVWHSFTPAQSGDYSVEVEGGEMGWVITVLDSCNDNIIDCDWGQTVVSLTQGVAYKIAVSSEMYGAYGQYTLTVTENVE